MFIVSVLPSVRIYKRGFVLDGFPCNLMLRGVLRKSVRANPNLFKIGQKYEGHLESKERFAIQRYLLIIGKKKNVQVL